MGMLPACCFHQRAVNNLLVFCLDMAQGHMNGAPSETQTHICRFVSQMFFQVLHQFI